MRNLERSNTVAGATSRFAARRAVAGVLGRFVAALGTRLGRLVAGVGRIAAHLAAQRTVQRTGDRPTVRCRVCGLPCHGGTEAEAERGHRLSTESSLHDRPAYAPHGPHRRIAALLVPPTVCSTCRAWMRGLVGAGEFPPAITGTNCLTTLGPYDGDLRRAVLAVKEGDAQVAALAGRALARSWRSSCSARRRAASDRSQRDRGSAAPVVTWVPSPWLRRLARGYTPARRLAVSAAAELGVPVRRLLATTHPPRPRQSQLGRAARQRNARGAFEPRHPGATTVLLVDDVVTTGATAEACAAALRRAGAREIHLLAVARTPATSAIRSGPQAGRSVPEPIEPRTARAVASDDPPEPNAPGPRRPRPRQTRRRVPRPLRR